LTKKQLDVIVNGMVTAVLLRNTANQCEDYVPTPAEEDEARTLVGMTIRDNRQKLIDAVPVIGSI
jgi:meiotically up-regulated gene 157 (Mug157) protein